MKDTAKKVLKTGFGLGLLTMAQAKKVAAQVKKDLDLDEAESKKLARKLVADSKKVSEDVLKMVGQHFEQVVVKSGVASKKELKVVKNMLKRKVKQARKKSKAVEKAVKKAVKKPAKKKKRR